MSGLELSSISGAAIPADVRAAGTEAEETYKAALGFERMMLSQLTKSMFSSAEGEGEGDEEGQSAATGAYKEMLPGTLADAVTNAGGIGLAEDLYKTMRGIA